MLQVTRLVLPCIISNCSSAAVNLVEPNVKNRENRETCIIETKRAMLGGHWPSKYGVAYFLLSKCVGGFFWGGGVYFFRFPPCRPCLPCVSGMIAKCVLSFPIKNDFLDSTWTALMPETLVL